MQAKKSKPTFISRVDIFRVLKLVYATHLKACLDLGINIQSGVFFETILQQEKVEEVLEQIASGVAPTREEYLEFVKSGDRKKIEEVISFYQNLRVNKQLFMLANKNYLFSFLAWEFYNLLRGKGLSFLITGESAVWSNTTNFPEQEFFDFVELLQERLKYCEISTKRWIDNALNEFRFQSEKIDQLFRHRKKLYITCLDIEFCYSLNLEENPKLYFSKQSKNAKVFLRILHDVLDSYHTYVTLEVNKNGCFKAFLVVVQKDAEQARKSELDLYQLIESHFEIPDAWKNITIRNMNEVFQEKCEKNAVGAIKNFASLQQFKYWVFGYIYFRERYLRPDYDDAPFQNRVYYPGYENPVLIEESLPRLLKKKVFNPPRLIGDIDLSKQQAQIWSHSHLPKKAKDHLQLLELLYRERETVSRGQSQTELYLKIESFMQTLHHYPAVFFEHSYHEIHKAPLKYITHVGKQYLELLRLENDKGAPLHYRTQDSSSNMLDSFFQAYKELYYHSENPLFFLIERKSFDELNNHLKVFKECMIAQKGDESESLRSKAIAKNQREATSYLKEKLKKDMLALRFRFNFQISIDEKSTLRAFKILLTDFLKNVKRRPSAIGARLSGYIGTFLYPENMSVDMVLLFQTDSPFKDANVLTENLQLYWQNYIKEKLEKIKQAKRINKAAVESQKDTFSLEPPYINFLVIYQAKLSASPCPVMASIPQLNAQSLLVHHYDNALKKIFIKSVVDYFTGYCLISKPDSSKQNGGSGFIKGSLVRKLGKTTVKAKSTSTSSSEAIQQTYHFVFKTKPSFVLLHKHASMLIPQAKLTKGA